MNVGKVLAGSVDYYVEQVADSAEEYYSVRGEAQGIWLGRGADKFGLTGDVKADAFRAVLHGRKPGEDVPLAAHFQNRKVLGIDTVFRAPKSVSLMYAIGDLAIRELVRSAHDEAVMAGYEYLEQNICWARQGRGGTDHVEGDGLISVAWEHRTSRSGDPLLHTHVVTANMVRTGGDKWLSLDTQRIYPHAKTAGIIYQAHLRRALTGRLGVAWGEVKNGLADVAGIDREVIDAFSKRSAEIAHELDQLACADSARAAQAAALSTRRVKGEEEECDLFDRWADEALDHGFGSRDVRALCQRALAVDSVSAEQLAQIQREMFQPDGFLSKDSTFTRRDVIAHFAERLPTTAGSYAALTAADRWISGNTIALSHSESARPGKYGSKRAGEETLTTHRQLRTEAQVLELAQERFDSSILSSHRPRENRWGLNSGQMNAIIHILDSRRRVDCIVGDAGTGKTHMLRAFREIAEHAGYEVVGVAVAHKARRELENGAGIESRTMASLLREVNVHGADRALAVMRRRPIVVVDEASMVSTRDMRDLLSATSKFGVKVVLVGDPKQLPAIGAGGAFAAISESSDAARLTVNRRQQTEIARTIADRLASGDISGAVEAGLESGAMQVRDSQGQALDALIVDWLAVGDYERSLVVAATNAEVQAINRLLQVRRRPPLWRPHETPSVRADGATYFPGDRIVFRRRVSELGIENGDFATVVSVDPDWRTLKVRVDGADSTVDVKPDVLDQPGAVRLGFATTVHVAQGATVENSFVLLSDQTKAEHAYVAFTRGRQSNRGYVARDVLEIEEEKAGFGAAPRADGKKRLTQVISRSTDKRFALPWGQLSAPGLYNDPIANALGDPPAYIEHLLGSAPMRGAARMQWGHAASQIEKYRKKYNLKMDFTWYDSIPSGPQQQRDFVAMRAASQKQVDKARSRAEAALGARSSISRGLGL